MRDSTIIYRSFYEAIKELPKTNQAEVWEAVFEYSLNFNEIELKGLSKTIFTLIKPNIAANIKKYHNGKQPKQKQEESKTEAKPKQNVSESKANVDVNVEVDKNVNVDKDKKKPSPDKSEGLTNPFLESYNAFLKKRTGTTEQFSVAGRTALKKIITYLKSQVSNKNAGAAPEFLDAETLKAWQWLLNHFEKWDKFHQGQLKLEQINSNLVNIISSIRNGNTTKSGTKQAVDYNRVGAEALTIVAASYGLTGTPNQHTSQGEQAADGGEGDFTDFQIVQ